MAGAKRKAGSGNKRAVARSGRAFGWRARLAAFALLLVLAGGAYAWWYGQNWRPDEGQWPDQGALVSASDGAVDFTTIKGLGAKLVYLEASVGAGRQIRGSPPILPPRARHGCRWARSTGLTRASRQMGNRPIS